MGFRDNELDQALWRELMAYCVEQAGSWEALAEQLRDITRMYGSESNGVTAANLKLWVAGGRLFRLWARLSVLHYAKEHGWTPRNATEASICYSLWLKANPGATLTEFASDFNIESSEILKFT